MILEFYYDSNSYTDDNHDRRKFSHDLTTSLWLFLTFKYK